MSEAMPAAVTTNGIVLRGTVAAPQGDDALRAMGERIAGALGPRSPNGASPSAS
jgi:NADH-quinone oxidoreductase subunit C